MMRIKLKWTIPDIIMTSAAFAVLAASTVILVANLNALPDSIPTHFNIAGEPDSYGSKSSVILPLVVGWALTAGIFVLEFFPSAWNSGVRITETNKLKVYRLLKSMIEWINLLISLVFSLILAHFAFSFTFFGTAMGILVAGIFAVIIIFIVRLLKAR